MPTFAGAPESAYTRRPCLIRAAHSRRLPYPRLASRRSTLSGTPAAGRSSSVDFNKEHCHGVQGSMHDGGCMRLHSQAGCPADAIALLSLLVRRKQALHAAVPSCCQPLSLSAEPT
jgi:hypothetical protein